MISSLGYPTIKGSTLTVYDGRGVKVGSGAILDMWRLPNKAKDRMVKVRLLVKGQTHDLEYNYDQSGIVKKLTLEAA